jgi:hypothetical protein
VVVVVVGASPFFRKAVHIELSDVGVHVFVFEKGGEDGEGEFGGICDDKAILLVVPVNNMAVFFFLDEGRGTDSIWWVLSRNGGAFL